MKKIIHVDMDYFFAQVEERDFPELKGKPLGIGGPNGGRGVLCTSNYEARKFGVKSAMPTSLALKLCPGIVLVKPNMHKYQKASEQVFKVLEQFSPLIQKVSIDEAYIDVTDCELHQNDAVAIARDIRSQILQETGLTASAGVSYNKLLAKIGSDLFKPNGLAVLRPQGIAEKISHFPISYILGVGKVTQEKMHQQGIYTFGDLQSYSQLNLINMFGDFGTTLFNYCRGIDHREIITSRERKSLSVERTFGSDISEESELDVKLLNLFEELKNRLSQHADKKIKNIFVKIKYFDFTVSTIETSIALNYMNLKSLFNKRYRLKNDPIRLVGLGVRFYCYENRGQLELPLEYA